VYALCFTCSQRLKLFDFPIFWLWAHRMKVIPKSIVRT
jgi:hypothetical protein